MIQILDLPLFKLVVPTPFHVGPINVFVIREPEIVLIDTGPKTPEAREALEKGLSELGLLVSDLKKILVTHGHPDHYGQAEGLARDSGATIYASSLDSHHFQHRTRDEFYAQLYQEAGVPSEVVERFDESLAWIQGLTDPIREYVDVREVGPLLCGVTEFQIVKTPGHTPGSICLWSAEKLLLVAADTVINRITPNPVVDEDARKPGQRFSSLWNYLSSLEKIRALHPRRVCSGHGEDVENFSALFQKMRMHHEDRQAKILGLLNHGPKTVWALSRELFPQVEQDNMFLALSEVFAHIDLLETRKRVRFVQEGKTRKIELVS